MPISNREKVLAEARQAQPVPAQPEPVADAKMAALNAKMAARGFAEAVARWRFGQNFSGPRQVSRPLPAPEVAAKAPTAIQQQQPEMAAKRPSPVVGGTFIYSPQSHRPLREDDPAFDDVEVVAVFKEKQTANVRSIHDDHLYRCVPWHSLTIPRPDRTPEEIKAESDEIIRRLNLNEYLIEAPPPSPREANAPLWTDEIDKQIATRFLELLYSEPPGFPVDVLPSFARNLIQAGAWSIHCPEDLLAVPMLAVAGAAIGRSGRWLNVKDGWITSSCLWTIVINESGSGKTPALNRVRGFYTRRQAAEFRGWQVAMEAYKADPENIDDPGPCPTLELSDTTLESLRTDLQSGPVLFLNDELAGWALSMGQYKSGKGGDKFSWCSFWSHSAVHIGRKTSERVYIEKPFVAVTGCLVPSCARELNYRGNADDGFVHRALLCAPNSMPPRATLAGVPKSITEEYDRRMDKLFDPPAGSAILELDPEASQLIIDWANHELFAELENSQTCPAYLASKYRKLHENCYRLCLVIHQMWRVADADERRNHWADLRYNEHDKATFDEAVIDRITAEKAIAVIQYFQAQIPYVVALLGETIDQVDRLHERCRANCKGKRLTVRDATRMKAGNDKVSVLALFAQWEQRGYGKIDQHRANGVCFVFGGET